MERELYLSILYDYYHTMLTDRQREIFDLYYNQNLSLGEIAEELEISRQGVRDSLMKAESTMKKLEENLRISEKNNEISYVLEELAKDLSAIPMSMMQKKRILEKLNKINEII